MSKEARILRVGCAIFLLTVSHVTIALMIADKGGARGFGSMPSSLPEASV